jgi:hypothetical protein
MNIYCTVLNINLKNTQNFIEKIYPQNKSSTIEQETVFLSEGSLLDISAEQAPFSEGIYLSMNYTGDKLRFQDLIENLVLKLDQNNLIYDLEYELEKDGNFESFTIQDSKYKKLIF